MTQVAFEGLVNILGIGENASFVLSDLLGAVTAKTKARSCWHSND